MAAELSPISAVVVNERKTALEGKMLVGFACASATAFILDGILAAHQPFTTELGRDNGHLIVLAVFLAIACIFNIFRSNETCVKEELNRAGKSLQSLRHWRKILLASFIVFILTTSGTFASYALTPETRACLYVTLLPIAIFAKSQDGRTLNTLAGISALLTLGYLLLDVAFTGCVAALVEAGSFFVGIHLFESILQNNDTDALTIFIPAVLISGTFTTGLTSISTLKEWADANTLSTLSQKTFIINASERSSAEAARAIAGLLEWTSALYLLRSDGLRHSDSIQSTATAVEVAAASIPRAFLVLLANTFPESGQLPVRLVLLGAAVWHFTTWQRGPEITSLSENGFYSEKYNANRKEAEVVARPRKFSLKGGIGGVVASVTLLSLWLLSLYSPNIMDLTKRVARPFTTDVVIAYYNENLQNLHHLTQVVANASTISGRSKVRFIVYSKSEEVQPEELLALSEIDEVRKLPNIGRETHTYLHHIIAHWDNLADQTIFLQDHLAWEPLPQRRLEMLRVDTGFLHLGRFTTVKHALDTGNNLTFPRLADYWNIFQEKFPPPEYLAGWSAQMAVSRKRIHNQPLRKWKAVMSMFESPADSWMHNPDENHSGLGDYKGGFGPSNPYFGHAMERSWPVAFNCTNHELRYLCTETTIDSRHCQCLDD